MANKVNNFIKINPEYPDTWGGSFWITLHAVASAYPTGTYKVLVTNKDKKEDGEEIIEQENEVLEETIVMHPTNDEKAHYKNFFETLEFILPCQECRDHWKIVLDKRPLTDAVLTNRLSLNRWLLDVHNIINQDLGKKVTFTWKQLTNRYVGVEEVPDKVRVRKITLSPQSISGTDIIPDKSLGMVNLKTPSSWRNAMQNINQTPKRAVQQVKTIEMDRPVVNGTTSKRKKCGCAGK